MKEGSINKQWRKAIQCLNFYHEKHTPIHKTIHCRCSTTFHVLKCLSPPSTALMATFMKLNNQTSVYTKWFITLCCYSARSLAWAWLHGQQRHLPDQVSSLTPLWRGGKGKLLLAIRFLSSDVWRNFSVAAWTLLSCKTCENTLCLIETDSKCTLEDIGCHFS